MKNIRRIVLVMACLLCIPGIHAQDFTVTGKVIDNTGLEVIGANISIKGSTGVGTITNIDGQYTLKVNNPAKDVLVISYTNCRNLSVCYTLCTKQLYHQRTWIRTRNFKRI